MQTNVHQICIKYASNMQKNMQKYAKNKQKNEQYANKYADVQYAKICKIGKKIFQICSLCKSFSNMQKLCKLCTRDFADGSDLESVITPALASPSQSLWRLARWQRQRPVLGLRVGSRTDSVTRQQPAAQWPAGLGPAPLSRASDHNSYCAYIWKI